MLVLLEVFGFVLVAIGIRQTRKHFNRPSLAAKLSQWFKLLTSAFRHPQAHTVVASTGRFNLEGGVPIIKATGTVGTLDIGRRIELVEQKLELFREETQKRTQRLEARFDEANKSFQMERGQRTVAIETLSRRVEDYAVGGLHLEIIGLVWLVVGTLGSNIAEEISELIG